MNLTPPTCSKSNTLKMAVIIILILLVFTGCTNRSTTADQANPTISSSTTSETPVPENNSPTSAPQDSFRTIAYVTDGYPSMKLIPYHQLTHINYAFVIPNADGSLQPIANGWKLQELVENAHKNGVQVLASVGGWGWDAQFEALAADSASRARFIDALDQFAQDYALDGIDIDWEYPGPEPGSAQNFVTLMRELQARFQPKGILLTTAVVALGRHGDDILPEVFEIVDFMNIMAYDGDGQNHSSYEYAVQALDYWSERGLPKGKMVLGVPFYGRPSEATYRELVANDSQAPTMDSSEYLGGMVFYNGIPTIQAKTQLALQRASGIMIWELSQDTMDETSLLNAIFQTVQGSK
jgi:GH18 family chitinase